MSQLIHKYIETTTKALDNERALIVTISTSTPDRYGDIMVPSGAKLSSYQNNPVVLFGHDGNALPVAKGVDLVVGESDIKAKVVFPSEGTYALSDTVYELAKQGFMNAWSIGFIPDFTSAEKLPSGGYKFNSWELLEFSAVPIPANPEALTIVRSFGLSDDETKQLVKAEGEVTDNGDGTVDVAPLSETAVVETEEQPKEGEETTETEEEQEPAVESVETTDESVELTFADGTTKTFAYAPKAVEAPKTKELLEAMRSQLQQSDKNLGLALKTMKELLMEGGEHTTI